MKLTIVGTSIGNIDDISPRAIETLANADIVLAEDTRVFGKLKSILQQRNSDLIFNHNQKILSYREQNHDKVIEKIINFLKDNKRVVQISDSGMPGISDPGFELYQRILNEGFELDVVPGPSSVITALVISGLPSYKFIFLGFLPRKTSKAQKLIEKALATNFTVICFESPYRIHKLIDLLEQIDSKLQISICKELTKKHQKVFRGRVENIKNLLPENIKGELVVVFKRSTEDQL
jgi:16S rRNA (cytidine1402-2'-O)-methyltransferase